MSREEIELMLANAREFVEGVLLTAKELAATLNVPLWRIYQLVDDGKAPPSMRIGKTLRSPRTE